MMDVMSAFLNGFGGRGLYVLAAGVLGSRERASYVQTEKGSLWPEVGALGVAHHFWSPSNPSSVFHGQTRHVELHIHFIR
eukprot:Gb_27116 [translate_table: standard]